MKKVLLRTQKNLSRFGTGLPIALLLLSSVPGRSSTYIFATPPGATTSNPPSGGPVPVNVQATLTVDLLAQTITVDLLNFQTNPQFDYQGLGSVQIDLTNLNGSVTAPTVQSGTFSAIDLNNAPTVAPHATQPPTLGDNWSFPTAGAYAVGPGILEFCADCIGNLGSKELVMGGPNPSTGQYDAAGNSISAGGHQPYILGSGDTYPVGSPLHGLNSTPEWVLKVPQLTLTSTITGVTFGFGTSYNTNQFATGQLVAPEPGPASMVFAGCLLIGLSVFLRQRRTSLATQPVSASPDTNEVE